MMLTSGYGHFYTIIYSLISFLHAHCPIINFLMSSVPIQI